VSQERRDPDELRRRGARYGKTKPDLDLAGMKRRVGDAIRELRMQSGLTQDKLAEKMRAANHTTWTADTVSAVQTGRNRSVHLDELLTLSRIFGVTTDEILTGALGEPKLPAQAQEHPAVELLDGEVIKYVAEMPPFQAAAWHRVGSRSVPAQREEIEALADRAGVKRNEMCRRLWAIAIPAYRKWLDQQGR
jgi:transcriptional regulator with XRE-family HTH domain